VNMGSPVFEKAKIPFKGEEDNLNYTINTDTKTFRASTLLLGVPHTVIYVDEINPDEVVNQGRQIEVMRDKFPAKTNVNFVKVIDRNTIEIRTWERGAGATLACGTGTCASVVACYMNGFTSNKVEARLFGGSMYIDYDGKDVFMEGPAEFICEGNTLLI
jgi:diaminopimelate epimerase